MGRLYNERRNRQIMVLVDRRKKRYKEIAVIMDLTYANVRKIISLWRKRLLVEARA